ncbi:MAG TPA: MBG domain-containing protein, partial [Verrucomicrobiae bacterium]
VPMIHAITGLEIGSFHGAYTAPYPVPFVIDSLQNDPRLRSDYPQPTPASELPDLNFQISFFSGTGPGSGQVYSRGYKISGPTTGDSVLPGLRVVPDAGGRYFYAALSQSVLRVDSQTGTGETMSLGTGVPELSWSMGMAFDSLRNRELLVSLGGEGYLYAYSPDRAQWSLVASMQDRDVDSIVHHASQDAIYGYEVYRSDYYHPRLFRFNASGVYQGEMRLPVFPWDVGVSSYASELVSVGDYLVLLIGPDVASGLYPRQRLESRMYLIDPRTSQVWLTYRHVPTNQLPSVVISSPANGATVTLGSPIHIKAQAFDPDGYLQSVEFFADGQSVGRITRNWEPFEIDWSSATLGTHLLTAKATDNDSGSTASIPVQVTVLPPPPVLHWSNPADIVYGTALGGDQLNATANIPGTFTYAPPAGAILGAGEHTLSVSFVPNDPAYASDTATVSLRVSRAPLSIRAVDKTRLVGQPNPPLTATYVGFVAGDNPASLDTPVTLTTTATMTSPPGSYPILASGASDANYTIAFQDGTLTVLLRPQVLPAPEDQDLPAIASDGANFLVVWLDRRHRAGESWVECDVYGARVTASGEILDPDGILIASNSVSASPPAVAFDGANYFVVWQRYESGSMGPIHGSRVTREGQLLDSADGFRIGAATGRLQTDAKVAFNGHVFLVAWNDWRNQTNGIPDNQICDIYGARVTPSGTVLDPLNIPIIKAPYWQTSAGVAAIGEQFLVVWEDGDGIRGARVGDSGTVSAPFLVSSGNYGSVARPVLAALGNQYFAAWEESFNLGNNVVWSWVGATRLSSTGVPLDGKGFGVRTNAGGYNTSLAITKAPESWWLAWNDENVYGTNRGIWGTRVSITRNLRAAIPINVLPVMQGRPAIGCNGSVLLAAWPDKRNTLSEPYLHLQFKDIFATLITLDGKVLDTNGFLVSSVALNTACGPSAPASSAGCWLRPLWPHSSCRSFSYYWKAPPASSAAGKRVQLAAEEREVDTMRKLIALMILLPLLGGCIFGPNYKRPVIDTPRSWNISYEGVAQVADTQWWVKFDDPVLNDLILITLHENRDLKLATARVDQFLGVLDTTRSQ